MLNVGDFQASEAVPWNQNYYIDSARQCGGFGRCSFSCFFSCFFCFNCSNCFRCGGRCGDRCGGRCGDRCGGRCGNRCGG
ncbi:heterocycloanthracin/sonorensin family bacteriocin [Aeribacillus pallidus]|uniref:heterocycloanthracin/sonorensin family bacteriocin n=1 Tax=Aeribacillus pallidus TaxID=33936 RepID=UPI003D239B0E